MSCEDEVENYFFNQAHFLTHEAMFYFKNAQFGCVDTLLEFHL